MESKARTDLEICRSKEPVENLKDMQCKKGHILRDVEFPKKIVKNLIVVDKLLGNLPLFEDCPACKYGYPGIAWEKQIWVGASREVKLCWLKEIERKKMV